MHTVWLYVYLLAKLSIICKMSFIKVKFLAMSVGNKQLIEKIRDFIRRFYLNRLIKGLLLGVILLFYSCLAFMGLSFCFGCPHPEE